MDTDLDKVMTSPAASVAEAELTSLLSQQPLSGREHQELEVLGKRERQDREIEERISSPMGCITCKRCKEIMPATSTHCPGCKAYNILNESDTPEEKKVSLIKGVEKLPKPLQIAYDKSALVPGVEIVKITARVVDNHSARGSQANRKPKSIQWKRGFARRIDRWQKQNDILGEVTVLRWWNEWPNAANKARQAGYTVEEFAEIIPVLQKLVDDKKSGIAALTSFMTREERLQTFARANVPIIVSDQHGGDTTRLYDEPAFRSANAVLDEYAVAHQSNISADRASRKGSLLAL